MNRTYRNTASFGKRQEYLAIAELLRRGFDVYQTLVDDQGIDCVIRIVKKDEIRYLELQIKARSRDAKNPGRFAGLDVPQTHPLYFFLFFSELANTYWILPAEQLKKEARRNKSGKNEGKYTINFCTGKGTSRSRYDEYKNRFDLLTW